MSKQDRQGVRTPADIERKYDLGQLALGEGSSPSRLESQLNQLTQTFAQYVASTNAKIAELEAGQTIENEVSGKSIALTDASNRTLKSLVFYGRTTQDGTPSADNPIELVSVGDKGNIALTLSDGEESQTMSVITPEGLRGIKVTEGGNYLDEDGNLWVCDEIDYEKGLYIQRIGYIESYLFHATGSIWMSTTGDKSVGATVIYALATPIETALTADEIGEYAKLHTYFPNTTIQNDEECHMKVRYVADTKSYIDNRIAKGGG